MRCILKEEIAYFRFELYIKIFVFKDRYCVTSSKVPLTSSGFRVTALTALYQSHPTASP